MQNITIQVDEEAAKAFNSSSEARRRNFETLFSRWLKDSAEVPSLLEMMDKISRTAREKGLTEEKLKELLADD